MIIFIVWEVLWYGDIFTVLIFQFLALGTHWGMIHILDHSGNNIRSKELPAVSIQLPKVELCKVNQVHEISLV